MLSLPTIVYRSPGPYDGTPIDGKATSYDCLGVKTEAELDAAMAAGWSARLVDALTGVAPAVVNAFTVQPFAVHELADAPLTLEPPTARIETSDLRDRDLDDLKAIAKDLDGYDGRLGREKLIALIEKARA